MKKRLIIASFTLAVLAIGHFLSIQNAQAVVVDPPKKRVCVSSSPQIMSCVGDGTDCTTVTTCLKDM